MYSEASETADDSARNALSSWALASESGYHLSQMVDLSKGALYFEVEKFDQNNWLLNVANGTLDLRTVEMHEHSPHNFITKLVPVDYIKGKRIDLWVRTLLNIFNGNEVL